MHCFLDKRQYHAISQWLMANSHCSSSNLMIAKLIMEILYSRETALDLLRLLWDSPNPNIPWINSHHHHRQLHCQNHGLFENKDTNQSYLYNLKIKILCELTSLFCCFYSLMGNFSWHRLHFFLGPQVPLMSRPPSAKKIPSSSVPSFSPLT